MAKKSSGLQKALSFFAWLTGVVVSLAVGFAMTGGGPLNTIPYIASAVTAFFGWVVILTTLISVVLAIINALK